MASAIKYIEETLELVKTYISTNLQTYLTVINVEKADGRTLTAPIASAYYVTEIDAIPNYPAIQFVPNTSNTVTAGLAGGIRDETDHNIIIKVHNVTHQGSTYDCAVRGYRFTKAIAEIILDNRTLGDQVIGIQIDNANYTPMMTDGTSFKTEVWINCTIKHHGTFI